MNKQMTKRVTMAMLRKAANGGVSVTRLMGPSLWAAENVRVDTPKTFVTRKTRQQAMRALLAALEASDV